MDKLAAFIVSRPKLIIALTFLITLLFAAVIGMKGVKFNSSPETLTRADENLQFFRQTQATFGNDRVIIVALEADDIFTVEAKERLDALTSLLASVSGVADALSLTNLSIVKSDNGGIVVERLLPTNASATQLQQLKQAITQDPVYARHYISTDGRTAAISVFFAPMTTDESHQVAEELERLVERESKGDLWLAGVPLMDVKGVRSMVRDVSLTSPIAAVLCLLTFFGAFRSFWGAALPLLTLTIGVVWTIGLMGLLDKSFSVATISLPVVLMAIGSSYFFHVLNQYRISMSTLAVEGNANEQRAAWLDGLRFLLPAVLVSGLTTIVGFAAHIVSPVPAAKDSGLFQAVGVAFMLLLTLFFIPAMLAILPRDSLGQTTAHKDYAMWMNGLLKNITALVLYRRRAVLFISLAATLLIGAGVWRMQVNTDYLKIFPRESDIARTAEKLHRQLAGASVLQIVVNGSPNAIKQPAFIQAVDRLENFARTQPGVDTAISIADIIQKFNAALPGKPEEFNSNPARLESIIDDYLSQDDSFHNFVSRDNSSTVIVLRTNLFGSNELRQLTDALQQFAQNNLPATIQARVTGSFLLLNETSDAVAISQASSLAIALVIIYIMMALLFRSLSTGLLALIPNLLPIFGFFGFLGWAGIALDITTSLVASSVLGLAVDNAVHILRRYRQSLDEKPEKEWAIWLTLLRTGKPMTLANLMLTAAFLIFTTSSFVPVKIGGMLWALTIFACLVADLLFLPALMQTKLFARAAAGNAGASKQQLQEERLEKAIR